MLGIFRLRQTEEIPKENCLRLYLSSRIEDLWVVFLGEATTGWGQSPFLSGAPVEDVENPAFCSLSYDCFDSVDSMLEGVTVRPLSVWSRELFRVNLKHCFDRDFIDRCSVDRDIWELKLGQTATRQPGQTQTDRPRCSPSLPASVELHFVSYTTDPSPDIWSAP